MNRWVLLKHKVSRDNLVDIHYDFLVEDGKDCLTWKLREIPTFNSGYVEIVKQSNHRIVWLSRQEYKLSKNRGFVLRIDNGTFIKTSNQSETQTLKLVLNGHFLNGFLEISGNFCRLTENN